MGHRHTAFARAVLTSLLIGVVAAALTGLAVNWYVTRRGVRPVTAMAQAASEVAEGRYAARVGESGLGTEFDAVGQAFNQMARQIAATERTRAQILRDLGHELRTPLTTIRAYHEALADGVLTPDRTTYATAEAGSSDWSTTSPGCRWLRSTGWTSICGPWTSPTYSGMPRPPL